MIKKIIILLTIITFISGIFFGYKLYKTSQDPKALFDSETNTDRMRTPFQTRVSTTTPLQNPQGSENTDTENPATTWVIPPRLVELWKEPVSGFDFIYKDIDVFATTTNNSSTTVVQSIKNKKILKNQEFIYFWDRKTGHIYENMSSTTDVSKISNHTLTGVEEVFFIDNTSIISRKLDDDNETIITQYTKLIKDTSTSTIYTALINNININANNISISPITKRLFYFIKSTGSGVLSSMDGVVKTNIINTTISEWLPQYVNRNIISLTTKPSAYFKGYLFFLNPDGNNKNTYIIGEKYGFNTLTSPDGKKVIYNEIINNTLETFIYDIKTKSNTYLSQSTIVDKCVWSNDSKKVFCGIPQKLYQAPYPDAWYKNEIEFSDNIWSIDAETGQFSVVVPLQDQVTRPIDVYKIKISNTNKYLIFQDKNTLNLWKFEI